jgi:hypothetical protein
MKAKGQTHHSSIVTKLSHVLHRVQLGPCAGEEWKLLHAKNKDEITALIPLSPS